MKTLAGILLLLSGVLLVGCQPEDQTPGLWLSGNHVETFPEDWSFSNEFGEISIEVGTPYFIPHSVTIWCVEVDGDLYIAAASAADKNWPGWVDADPNVVLKVGENVYEAKLETIKDMALLKPVQGAYVAKYNLGEGTPFQSGSKYWRVTAPDAG